MSHAARPRTANEATTTPVARLPGGIELAYDELGNPTASPVLLIMGLGCQLTFWPDAFPVGLVEAGFRTLLFDNRDVGLSTHLDDHPPRGLGRGVIRGLLGLPVSAPYTLHDMADDTVGLLDVLGIGKVHLVGASMGGMIAQLVAVRAPERVLSLTSLMSNSGHPWTSRPRLRALRQILRRPASLAWEDIIDLNLETLRLIGSPAYPYPEAELRALVKRNVDRSYDPTGFARQVLAVAASTRRYRLLSQISAPTLVLHGDADILIPAAGGRDTSRRIPGARLQIIPGMGHDLAPGLIPILLGHIVPHLRAADGAGS